jgi:hypothetical protein
MRYITSFTRFFLALFMSTYITTTVSIKAHDVVPDTSESKNNSLGWGATAVGLYTIEKTGRVLRRVAKNQSLRWVVKNPIRAGGLATTLLIGLKRPHSLRATLALIARTTGTTLHTSAKITRGMSFVQTKLGDGLHWSGKKLLQNSIPLAAETSEIRIPFRLSDGTIEYIIHTEKPAIAAQKPTLINENIYSLYHLTA